jgi:acyl carrier protein
MPFSIKDLSEPQLGALEQLLKSRADNGDGAKFVAYYVPLAPDAPSPAEIKAYAERRLPPRQVPVCFAPVPALPDRIRAEAERTLPGPGWTPSTDVERWIAGIWASVLGVPAPDTDVDFFKLGGSSLRAVQVLARVKAVLGLELPLVILFENRTVAALAAVIEARSDQVPGFEQIVTVAAEVYADQAASPRAGG